MARIALFAVLLLLVASRVEVQTVTSSPTPLADADPHELAERELAAIQGSQRVAEHAERALQQLNAAIDGLMPTPTPDLRPFVVRTVTPRERAKRR